LARTVCFETDEGPVICGPESRGDKTIICDNCPFFGKHRKYLERMKKNV